MRDLGSNASFVLFTLCKLTTLTQLLGPLLLIRLHEQRSGYKAGTVSQWVYGAGKKEYAVLIDILLENDPWGSMAGFEAPQTPSVMPQP